MAKKFNLFAIYGVAYDVFDGGPLNSARLPLHITQDVFLEDVSPLLKDDTFEYAKSFMGSYAVDDLKRLQYVLIHRFDPQVTIEDGNVVTEAEHEKRSREKVETVAACLRLIRPMRQLAGAVHGNVRADGTLDVMGFDRPFNLLEVPEFQKLSALRDQDVDDLLKYAPDFFKIFTPTAKVWKAAMAVQFHDLGYFEEAPAWKGRYLLWASAIESIYTSHNSGHKGSTVAKERIKWFLGDRTSIDTPGDLSSLIINPTVITVGSIADDLYTVRNFLAHGDKIPDNFFNDARRKDLGGGDLSTIRVLFEALSFIIRASILKIVRDKLFQHFKDAPASEAYFQAAGLTLRQIQTARKAKGALP